MVTPQAFQLLLLISAFLGLLFNPEDGSSMYRKSSVLNLN
jgi:hypothetical protein